MAQKETKRQVFDGRVSILFSDEGLTIRLQDDNSSLNVVEINLDAKQTCQALSRLSHTHCKFEAFGIENLGKDMQHVSLEFSYGDDELSNRPTAEVLKELADKACPEGWVHDNYFNSQGSFFRRDGKAMARTRMRRWVDSEEETDASDKC